MGHRHSRIRVGPTVPLHVAWELHSRLTFVSDESASSYPSCLASQREKLLSFPKGSNLWSSEGGEGLWRAARRTTTSPSTSGSPPSPKSTPSTNPTPKRSLLFPSIFLPIFFFFFLARSHFTSPMQWSVIPMFFFSNLVTLKSFYLQICDRLLLIICLIDKCLRLISFC